MKPTVIFDLDGTLADTSGDLIAAANACFADQPGDQPLCAAGDAAVSFQGGRAMLRLGQDRLGLSWSDAQAEAKYQELLQHYGAHIDVHTVLYPGAIEAVGALTARGYAVGICTNKPEGLAQELLTRLGVRDRFAALVGADTLPVRKPDPAPLVEVVHRVGGDMSRCCLIGDTITDHKTARAAGARSVLVTFGPAGQQVRDLGPDALLDRYEDLPALVQRLLGD